MLLETPTQQPFDATHLLTQRGIPHRCFASKLGGGVSVDKHLLRMVRTLDVSAAQAHMRRTTGQPFVTAPSELTGKFTRRTRTR